MIQRYHLPEQYLVDMEQRTDGEYVLFEDYDAISRRCAELEAALDAGISFKRTFNDHLPTPMKHEPIGTNLFDASQAEQMVRYMIQGMPSEALLQAQQGEPEAWRVHRDTDYESREYFHTEAEAIDNSKLGVVDSHITPLYLHPPVYQEGASVPEGFVLVPREPTGEMWSAATTVARRMVRTITEAKDSQTALAYEDTLAAEVYKAMLAAAPGAAGE